MFWSLPKGGLEEGESKAECARREIEEETGIKELELVGELGAYERYSIAQGGVGEERGRPMGNRTFFLFKTTEHELRPSDLDGEITEARWVSIDEALSLLTHPKDVEFLSSVRDRVR